MYQSHTVPTRILKDTCLGGLERGRRSKDSAVLTHSIGSHKGLLPKDRKGHEDSLVCRWLAEVHGGHKNIKDERGQKDV